MDAVTEAVQRGKRGRGMTLDNMTGITEGSYTGFCKSQLITCNFVKACNGVCPFEDALKHADKTQTMNGQHTVDHDKDWIIGCIEHDGFIHTHRFDKANQIIHDALSAEAEWIPCSERLPSESGDYLCTIPLDADETYTEVLTFHKGRFYEDDDEWGATFHDDVLAWMPLPEPYKGGDEE